MYVILGVLGCVTKRYQHRQGFGVLKINRDIAGVAGVTESLSCMLHKAIGGK